MIPWIPALPRVAAFALALCLAIPACFGQDPAKPRCTGKIRGTLWPEAANTDHKALQRAARSGKLEVCAATTWRYRWQPMTVTVTQLAEARSRHGKSAE
jgi:hypothetical protein